MTVTPAPRSAAKRRRLPRNVPLLIICVIGVALRLAWLFQPIRCDESVTYLGFVRGGFVNVVTNYAAPNNHVFHSVLVYLSTRRSSALWAIRLPAFIAGSLVPVATYHVGRRLYGRKAAAIGAALAACSAHLIEFSTNARGHSIVTLFALLQILLADRIVRRGRHRDLATFAVVTALGFYTVPTMLYPTAATLVWAVAVALANPRATPWWKLAWRAPVYAALAAALTYGLYLPILWQPGGYESLTANRWVEPAKSLDAWHLSAAQLATTLVDEWSLGLTTRGLAVVGGLALVGAVAGVVRRRDARPTWAIVAAGVIATMLAVQLVTPFARVFCFALPMLLLTGAAGLLELLPAGRVRRATPAFAIVLCAGLATYVIIDRSPDRAVPGDRFPEAAAVVAFLTPKAAAGDAVIFDPVAQAPVDYVLFRKRREPFAYREQARRLWIVARSDESVLHAMKSRGNRLNPADFETPRIAFAKGVARVYEAIPRTGGTRPRTRHRV